MNQVIDHIDLHLAEPLVLAELFRVANFSPFHFHRLFVAWMGETVGEYLGRRRLEAGALLLAHERRRTVLAIALEVGFASSEAFARAFKQRFGMTPSTQPTPSARKAACLPAGQAVVIQIPRSLWTPNPVRAEPFDKLRRALSKPLRRPPSACPSTGSGRTGIGGPAIN
ncbi:helix-turn-helix transcriptional regulator [Azohydromonas caseinilytica]|nr:AraC family transcriptional regulator [Azohydromonas caseinilytica]